MFALLSSLREMDGEQTPPDQSSSISVVVATLVVCTAAQSHDVVAPLLDEHADDALNPVADEIAPHLYAFFLGLHKLRPAEHLPCQVYR